MMDVPNCEYGANGTFIFADCGLNQDPTSARAGCYRRQLPPRVLPTPC
ncbi:MAG: hypothetical protein ACLR2E_03270 [Lachnospiraceae bacterium]